jgi:hypothetical protein
MENSVLFVFCTLSKRNAQLNFLENIPVPEGWHWTGSGSVRAEGDEIVSKYKSEIQFNGPTEKINAMRQYLELNFSKFLEDEVVLFYVIRPSFLPIPL